MLEISTTDKNDRVSNVYTQGDTNLGTVRTRTINLDHYRKPFFSKSKLPRNVANPLQNKAIYSSCLNNQTSEWSVVLNQR